MSDSKRNNDKQEKQKIIEEIVVLFLSPVNKYRRGLPIACAFSVFGHDSYRHSRLSSDMKNDHII